MTFGALLELWSAIKNGAFKNPKTTVVGIVQLILVVGTQALYFFDNDPVTVFNLQSIVTAVTVAFGLTIARDNDVSSEQSVVKSYENNDAIPTQCTNNPSTCQFCKGDEELCSIKKGLGNEEKAVG